MRKKGIKNKVYTAEFKALVIETMRKDHLGLFETISRFELSKNPHNAKKMVRRWERIYLEEGVTGFMEEHRGKASKISGTQKGRPPKLDKVVEKDLIDEVQCLRMENDYLKKLHALAQSKIKSENETKHK